MDTQPAGRVLPGVNHLFSRLDIQVRFGCGSKAAQIQIGSLKIGGPKAVVFLLVALGQLKTRLAEYGYVFFGGQTWVGFPLVFLYNHPKKRGPQKKQSQTRIFTVLGKFLVFWLLFFLGGGCKDNAMVCCSHAKVAKHPFGHGQNQWYHFGIGAPPVLVYFGGDGMFTGLGVDFFHCFQPSFFSTTSRFPWDFDGFLKRRTGKNGNGRYL